MIMTTRIAQARRAPAATSTAMAASSATDRWEGTLTGLVRSHRARLRATDPSRPWLTRDPQEPSPSESSGEAE